MLIYKLVKDVDVQRFERLVTESLQEGWELAGSICMIPLLNPQSSRLANHLVQPMAKHVIKIEAEEYLAEKEL